MSVDDISNCAVIGLFVVMALPPAWAFLNRKGTRK